MQPSNCSNYLSPTTSFKNRPIGSLATLARMLRLSEEQLAELCLTADVRYRIGARIRKQDGSFRICYDALGPLKSAQARIQCLILNSVLFPRYLQGGIKDRLIPRGQAPNARHHTRQQAIITLDIRDFFGSVGSPLVFGIWHEFFGFPPIVARSLTLLTTKGGFLPQGTKTSNQLANLVFWDVEEALVEALVKAGIVYTRLTDDITCSCDRELTVSEKTWVIRSVRSMCLRKGLRINPRKTTVASASGRMVATKLIVNRKTSLALEKRKAIRAEVHKLSATSPAHRTTREYRARYASASGRVSYLNQHHADEAARLREILDFVRP